METVPKIVRERLQAVKPVKHPEANLLAAFAEKSLTPRELSQVLDHLAGCTLCRETVSLSQSQNETQHVVAANTRKASWFSARVLQWGTLAACVAVAGTAVLVRHQRTGKSAEMSKYYDVATQPRDRLESQVSKSDADNKKRLDDAPIPKTESTTASANATSKGERARLEEQRLTAKEVDSRRAFGFASTPEREPASVTDAIAEKPAAPPPPVLQKLSEQEEAKKEIAGDKVQSVAPITANEVANVVPVAPSAPAETVVIGGQAKNAPSAEFRGQAMAMGRLTKSKDSSANDRQSDELRSKIAFPKIRWQISAEGKIMRSQDLGESWQPVQVADNVVFRALCVTGHEVWVGGSQGNLFYSSDAGTHWEQIKPSSGGQALVSDISQIQFADSQHGTVITTDQQTWTTADGGHSWRKQ